MGKYLRHHKEETRPSAPIWMITFADMMSLLLGFFVLVAAFSTINERKLQQAITSIQGSLGRGGAQTSLKTPGEGAAPGSAEVKRAGRDLQRKLQVSGHENDVSVQYDKDGGLKITLPEKISFDTASAELKSDCYTALETIGQILATLGPKCFFEVRGHTDSRPLAPGGRFRDNYDLSFSRADAVARRVAQVGKINMDQFEIIACGSGQPAATNETEEGQRVNRRVEILVRNPEVRSTMGPLQPPGKEGEGTMGTETAVDASEAVSK